ncbi:MAG: hypothetical protein IJC17_04185 [Clostridia bacterium]|nr:hypothetical protein [Clostridia bacterium]
MCHRSSCWGGYFAAFGIGLLVANIFPHKLLLFILAAALILLGFAINRR